MFDCQDRIIAESEKYESKKFIRKPWKREDGLGHGVACVLQDGDVWEKAGCLVTTMRVPLSEASFKNM